MESGKTQRNTQQRRVIYEELGKLTSHPTAAELYAIVRKRLPKISLGTVYRNLEILVKNDIIRKIEIGGAKTRFDAERKNHHHVRCLNCGRLDDLRDIPAKIQKGHFVHPNGYKVLECRIEFVGICPACRAHQKSEENRIQPSY
jgi:Fur family ferric uptake transcriptional regulator